MQHKLRVSAALTALALVAGCADSPVAPKLGAGSLDGRTSPLPTASGTPEYDWTFEKKILAIFGGTETDMILEPSTTQTLVGPGEVKWIEYELTATRTPAADYPAGTVITKDAKAQIHEKLWEACKNLFPMLHCTWYADHAITFPPYIIEESNTRMIMLDLRNFFVCGMDLEFTNVATLTELGPYPPGTSPQVRESSASLLVKTGVCPPKPANPGCTLTQGYWKNHDWPTHPIYTNSTLETWEEVNGWPELEWHFFDTKLEWKDVLSIEPRGNAYFILAHQYIAAVLNQQSGAYVPEEVRTALLRSYEYFSMTAEQRARVSRDVILAWKDVLDRYNNGQLGVPHCNDNGKGGKKKKNA